MKARIVFMGSPEFSLPVLQMLAREYKVVGVVTQPDRPSGRGRAMTPPPVKQLALSLGIPVIQPEKLKQPENMAQLAAWKPDLIVVAAFGQILRQNVLDLPPFGCVNVHASLLPLWRGASPIQAAILHGDQVTGVTIMKMDAGVDTGAILAQREVEILPDDTTETLSERLSLEGAELLKETLPAYLSGRLSPVEQDSSCATYAPMLKKEDGLLSFDLTAQELVRRVRGLRPWPGAYFFWGDTVLKVHRASALAAQDAVPGQRSVQGALPAVGTASGWLVLDEVQPAGKKSMSGEEFLRGARHWVS
ncbi:MAG: methionyl-tRNA formyltransferase [Anaerolineae bacterium]|nr:methionyl-tRNA formyltransferase [Anaerolineae bacterium]